nr:MAG TPA: putative chitinase [Caudoviricetes sp.]
MANLQLLNRANFSKEIIERTYNASSVITELTTVFKVLRTAKKLPFDKKAEQDFLALTGKYDSDLYLSNIEALRLTDLLNTIIKLKDNVDTDSLFKAGDIIKDYRDMFAKSSNLTRQNQLVRKRELAELLRVIGKEKEAKQLLSKNDDQIFNFLEKVAKNVSDKNTTVKYDSLDQIQKIIKQQENSLLKRIKRSPKTLLDTAKTTSSKDLAKLLKKGVKGIGGGALELALNLGGSSREEMAEMFKDLRGGKDSARQQLRDLRQEELDRRTQEETRDYLKKLSENEVKDKPLPQTDEEIEYQNDSLEELRDTKKISQDGFYQLVDKSRDMISGIDRVSDKLEDTSQEIRKLSNQFKFLSDDLKRLNNKKDKNDDDSSILDDLSDLFDLDFDGKRKGKKGKKKGKKGKKGKVKAKTPKKLGKVGKLGNLAKGGLSKLGGVAKFGASGLSGMAKFAGPVGLALTAGMALSDAYSGFDKDKADSLGFDGNTVKGKANSALASAGSGLTFGLVDESTIADGIKFKDKLDDKVVDALGGKDSVLGKVAGTVLNPFDNAMGMFDKISDWFSDKKKEEKTKSDKEELTDAQKAVKGVDPTLATTTAGAVATTTAGAVATTQLSKYNNLDSAFNTDDLDPLANGFQNMFDYMSQIPGIGEFFKDKSSGKVDSSVATKAMNMFNPLGAVGSVFSSLSNVFSGMQTPNYSSGNYSTNQSSGNNSNFALPMPQVSNKTIEGTGAAKQARDAYIEIAKKNGRSSQDIQFALANMARETGGFTKSAGENMNYSSAERIMQVHGAKIRKWGGDVNTLVKNPEALANVVYSDHNGSNLGNTEQGDGWRYRGRGLVQLTGRSNYRKYGKILGIDLEGNPDLASDPQVAAQVADAYLKERSYGKDFNSFSAGIIGNVKSNPHGIDALEKGRAYLGAAGSLVGSVASPIAPQNNQQQAQSITPSGQLEGMMENVKGTKVNESQKQAIQSGKLKLQTGFKAQGMEGYDPNQQYFQAPKGKISQNDVSKLDPRLYQNLNMMAHEYQATTGNKFVVTNSFRTGEEQAALKAAGYKANKPGYSLHEYGLAVDIQPSQAQELEKMGLLKKYGFYRPLPNDPMEKQHIQPLSIASSTLANVGDTQVPDETNKDGTNGSNPTASTPKSLVAGQSTESPSNPTSNLQSTASSVTGALNNISSPNTQNNAKNVSSTVSNMPQSVTQTPTASEQTKIEIAQQRSVAQQSQGIVQNNITNQPANGQGISVGREDYFDDLIHDVGLSMFNRMQLG